MKPETYALTTGLIFLVIALLHLARLILGWEAVIGGWAVPTWVSVVALLVAASLGYEGLKLSRKA
ncbi:MAG: hypothetical protein A3F90_07610 [Deltaproteobacteria bacterium RIFCSPLOWO2_12_FULL_60_19]|nr:MAG: hypothetical protein A3F90_07610 [Deltaproteobacteria bacterium RIFCSPLOWO2_12_FULL_60_19]